MRKEIKDKVLGAYMLISVACLPLLAYVLLNM